VLSIAMASRSIGAGLVIGRLIWSGHGIELSKRIVSSPKERTEDGEVRWIVTVTGRTTEVLDFFLVNR
jgi:hypothetical protein